jgi:hypothetical protein
MSILDATPSEDNEVDDRDVRAATEYLYVLPFGPAMYEVYSEDGEQYRVDLRIGGCTCSDWRFREPDEGCKHVRRVLMALGERDLPESVAPGEVDRMLAERPAVTEQLEDDHD